jgi:hypothetical protein
MRVGGVSHWGGRRYLGGWEAVALFIELLAIAAIGQIRKDSISGEVRGQPVRSRDPLDQDPPGFGTRPITRKIVGSRHWRTANCIRPRPSSCLPSPSAGEDQGQSRSNNKRSRENNDTDGGRGVTAYPRRRALTACQLCRVRKTRCDNARPTCSYCARLGVQCSFASTTDQLS